MLIRRIKSWKTVVPDNIPTEALMSHIGATENMFHVLFRKDWEEEQVLTDWKGHVIKIPKKRDLNKCVNYRGISLLPVPGKVYNCVDEPNERFGSCPVSRSTDRIT
ncbi:unnamed protein product [Schistosoma rodhaini]|uniref:Uncharacterized protein n=1 Tax=Schistosoma rodhaini TaxID=6188 RepID=A0AA85G252_9TREM|nr:unnamed protein product [Schistosoma rodhaini]